MKPTNEDRDKSYSPGKAFSMLNPKVKYRKRSQPGGKILMRHGKWKCHICGILCSERTCLATHLKYTHSDLAYRCFCGRAFSRPSNMRKHVQQMHPECDPTDASLMQIVKRTELTEAQQLMMRKLSVISRKRKIFQTAKMVLPTIKAFNCHDCEGVYDSITKLFEHCRLAHRIADDGTKFPYLVPVSIPR